MHLANLTRASGLAGISGGLLIALFFILHPGGQEPGSVQTILSTPYALEHTLAVAAYILIMLALPAAYSLQAERCGFLGLLGFVLAFIGSALMVGVFMHDGYALPHEATLTTSLEPVGAMNVAVIVAAIAFVAGFVIFGFVTMRAGVFPRWAGALLIVGSIVTNLPPPPDTNLLNTLIRRPIPLPWMVLDIGASLLGAGLVWVGIGLWSGRPTARG